VVKEREEGTVSKIWGVSLPIWAVINYICAVVKPRLSSDKTGIYFERMWMVSI